MNVPRATPFDTLKANAVKPTGQELIPIVRDVGGGEVRESHARIDHIPRLPIPQLEVEGASYTLRAEDVGYAINAVGSDPIDIMISVDLPFAVGQYCNFYQLGAGQITLVPETGVTINTAETLKSAKQFAVMSLEKKADNEFLLFGNLESA